MAEKEYTVVAPDGKEITLIGPVGASQDEVIAQAQKLYKPLTTEKRTQGTNISSDVPNVITSQNRGSVAPVEPSTSMMDKLKALYEVPATIGSGAIAQPVGAAYGVYKGMTSPNYGTQQGVQEGQQAGAELANKLQYQPTSPASVNALESIGGAIEATKLPPYVGNIGAIPSFQQFARPAANQMANALRNEAGMVKEAVTPVIQRGVEAAKPVVAKVAETIEPVTSRMAQALRTEPKIDIAGIAKTAPELEDLAAQSSALFKQAKESGVELNPQYFSNMMKSVGKDLRAEGYDARLMPKVGVALEEMQNAKLPKDFEELSTLRKFIQNAQKSVDPDERRIASILKSEFDDYVANIPESSVIGGNKQGLTAWKEARDTYAKMSKSEVFTDMLENAELDKTKFSMSGAENSLSQQLRQLAKNDKKMRLFTKEEQEAIKQAAKGTNTQNMLRIFGKFAPTSAVSSIPALLATSVSGPLGLATTAGAMGARVAATKMRKSDVKNLAALMRAGGKKVKEMPNE